MQGPRCATTSTPLASRDSDNNANVIALGARVIAPELAVAILDVFLATAFQGGRHQRRLDELTEIEDAEAER